MEKAHDWKTLYSGLYPDGAKIKTELCNNCGIITLIIRRTGEDIDQQFVVNQVQACEIAYAMLKGINKFQHIVLDQQEQFQQVRLGDK